MPPKAGTRNALSDAILISQANAIDIPAPAAAPGKTAMVGFGNS